MVTIFRTRYADVSRRQALDAIKLLKNDHDEVEAMFKQFFKMKKDGPQKSELIEQICTALTVHAEIEEEIFYPALEESNEARDITLEAYEEHRLVKQLLGELEAESKDTEEWTAKFTVLKENIEHHVEEEEGELFKKARQVLSEEEIEALGQQLLEAKRQSKTVAA